MDKVVSILFSVRCVVWVFAQAVMVKVVSILFSVRCGMGVCASSHSYIWDNQWHQSVFSYYQASLDCAYARHCYNIVKQDMCKLWSSYRRWPLNETWSTYIISASIRPASAANGATANLLIWIAFLMTKLRASPAMT